MIMHESVMCTMSSYCSRISGTEYYSTRKMITHFTVPRRVKGRVDLGGWLHTEDVYTLTDGHPPQY